MADRHRENAPIGFYFAKLWYYERLYPLVFAVAALGRAVRRWAPRANARPDRHNDIGRHQQTRHPRENDPETANLSTHHWHRTTVIIDCSQSPEDSILASASVTPSTSADGAAAAASRQRSRTRGGARRAHLKLVPEPRELRDKIRQRCDEVAARLDKSHPLSKDTMETIARATLDDLALAEGYVGWTMVMLASAFWRDQVAAIPPSRRLFLLPHCLKHTEQCTADYNEFGLDCKQLRRLQHRRFPRASPKRWAIASWWPKARPSS